VTRIGAERASQKRRRVLGAPEEAAGDEGDEQPIRALPPETVEALGRIVVVLDHTKDLVNIAGVARVMMNFGLTRLRLVKPDEFDTWRIGGIAHKSQRITEVATLHDTLDEAVADASFVVGTSARARTAGRSYTRPREVAAQIAERAQGAHEGTVAIVFGREDRGLTNEALDRCHAVTVIPTDPAYKSLNLAQACLLLSYEVFLALGEGTRPLPKGRRATRPPTQEELEATYAALEKGLGSIDFFKTRKPESVLRTLRTLITRAQPDLREARLIAAIGHEIKNKIERKG